MLALEAMVFAEGLNVAVRVSPVPLMAVKVPDAKKYLLNGADEMKMERSSVEANAAGAAIQIPNVPPSRSKLLLIVHSRLCAVCPAVASMVTFRLLVFPAVLMYNGFVLSVPAVVPGPKPLLFVVSPAIPLLPLNRTVPALMR